MRLVRVKRRSTAHYQRHLPPDVDWAGQNPLRPGATGIGSGLSVARQFTRRTQLEVDNAEWMRRTLQRVTVDGASKTAGSIEARPEEDDKTSAPPPHGALSSHQLRQMERDRLIRERRERGQSLLSLGQQQHQQQQDASRAATAEAEANSLQVKGLHKGSGGANAGRRSEKSSNSPKQLRAPPPPLALSPTPYIQQTPSTWQTERLQLQSIAKQQQLHQTQLRRPRRLGGLASREPAAAAAARRRQLQRPTTENRRLEILSSGPVPGGQQGQQTPVVEQSAELAKYLRMQDKDRTLVQPRNPMNSPELLAP